MFGSRSIVNDINQQLTQLLQQLHYPREILPFSRISLENFVFGKLEQPLAAMYCFKNVQTE